MTEEKEDRLFCPECKDIATLKGEQLKNGKWIHRACLQNNFDYYLKADLVKGFENGKLVKRVKTSEVVD